MKWWVREVKNHFPRSSFHYHLIWKLMTEGSEVQGKWWAREVLFITHPSAVHCTGFTFLNRSRCSDFFLLRNQLGICYFLDEIILKWYLKSNVEKFHHYVEIEYGPDLKMNSYFKKRFLFWQLWHKCIREQPTFYKIYHFCRNKDKKVHKFWNFFKKMFSRRFFLVNHGKFLVFYTTYFVIGESICIYHKGFFFGRFPFMLRNYEMLSYIRS